mmetsp:Transcript_61185/g.149808  ORF Transcript_61185/g.149808 Transcript_61185/m.149808 type:complete len:175 (-) Transcript_61185:41-565(-)
MNDHACEKSVKKNVFLMAFNDDESSSSSLLLLTSSQGNGDASDNLLTDDLTASGDNLLGGEASKIVVDEYDWRFFLTPPDSRQSVDDDVGVSLQMCPPIYSLKLIRDIIGLCFKTHGRTKRFMTSQQKHQSKEEMTILSTEVVCYLSVAVVLSMIDGFPSVVKLNSLCYKKARK